MAKLVAHGAELARIERPPVQDKESIEYCQKTVNAMTPGHADYNPEVCYHGPHFITTRKVYALMSDGHILRKLIFVYCGPSHRPGEPKQSDVGWKLWKRFNADVREQGREAMVKKFMEFWKPQTQVATGPSVITVQTEEKK